MGDEGKREEEAGLRLVLVARKGGFGLPTACPSCLPVYVSLRLANVPFDLHFDSKNPDSGQGHGSLEAVPLTFSSSVVRLIRPRALPGLGFLFFLFFSILSNAFPNAGIQERNDWGKGDGYLFVLFAVMTHLWMINRSQFLSRKSDG